ncbi:MAG: alpha/beta fold hydrolase [Acidobacteriota bacterium]
MNRRRVALLTLPAIVLVAIVALRTAVRTEPRDPYDRTIGKGRVETVIDRAGTSTRACRCMPDRSVAIDYAGFTTHGDLYGTDRLADGDRPKASVLLIHGNTARGRRLATYRALASRLAARGAVVFAYDQLGFGDSDDPFGRGPEAARLAYDRTALAVAALARFGDETALDPERITVVGHSGGALPALRLALDHPDVGSAVLIGPPRRVEERSNEPVDVAYFAERFRATYRWVYERELPDWLLPEHLGAEGPYSLEEHLVWPTAPGLGEAGHVPLLFVDGGREDADELAYMEAFLDRIAEPRSLLRQERSDHYLNTSESLGWVVYDAAVVDELADAILILVDEAPRRDDPERF